MHLDVERLIDMAKGTGFITLRQREMILGKAREVGDDIVEVEFYLNDIPVKEDFAHTNNTQTYAHPESSYFAQQPNSIQHNTTKEENPKKKRKKGRWIWIVLLIIVVGVVIFATASIMSDDASINNYYNNVNYTNWDDELTRFNNGWDSYFGELAMGRPMDEVDKDYQWLLILNNNIENASLTGQLTTEQQNRYTQIINKVTNQTAGYALGAGAMYLIDQIFN